MGKVQLLATKGPGWDDGYGKCVAVNYYNYDSNHHFSNVN